ncbi:hypothetical protein OE766_24215 [Pararhizobium sp. YC-54]|uniref:hypothetical protein n=1 Tax=Pararhizobium sp. YC-54 TaxID=2986920 RepID=UPI0021F7E7A6|nr:hypothetical protein [Pararhizobium sp. YC-54]MCW0001331.1 hypothetical protein [Pararhizobium sp. YC-54]
MPTRITEEIGRLRKLLTDLERLEAGTISPPALMAVPFLDQWIHSPREVPCLEGVVEGHPSLFDGHQILTSEVYAHLYADDEHFVRTLNRWYRLGSPRRRARC